MVQNRTGTEHATRLFLEAWEGAGWRVSLDGEELQPQTLGHRQAYRLPVTRTEHELTVERR